MLIEALKNQQFYYKKLVRAGISLVNQADISDLTKSTEKWSGN